jgi:hypothetical protein
MTFFLTTLPLWFSGFILIVPTILLAMAGPGHRAPLHRRQTAPHQQ